MTDPSSDPRRRRRRSGRHQQPDRRPQSPPLPPDEARRNRDAAFGSPNPKRTWLSAESAPAPTPSSASTPPAEAPTQRLMPVEDSPAARSADRRSPSEAASEPESPSPRPRGRRAAFPLAQLPEDADAHPSDGQGAAEAQGAPDAEPARPGRRRAPQSAEPRTEQDLWSAASAPENEPLAPPADQRAAQEAAGAAAGSGPASRRDGASGAAGSSADPGPGAAAASATSATSESSAASEGSLPKVAFWTVLTSLIPGSGLVPTRRRRTGLVMLGVLVLVLAVGGAFLLFGDPLRTGALLASRRGVLIAAMITVAVIGIVWALQIVLANLAHSTRQRLAGTKKYLALALAAVMVVCVALPFGRGVQSLWALQGLMGSTSVFGGGEGGEHPFSSGKDPWANAGRVNIMLLGQDAGADRTGTRPDTIMVASIDTRTGKTALFSIPRNLENVRFPEGTAAAKEFPDGFDYFGPDQNLINAVWTWAEDRKDLFPGDPEPGLTATRWAVEETLGLETDYYAMVNLQGFEDLVNALGGVDLVVERRIPIGGGAADIEGYIEPGEQKLDGFHALWYARSREGSNDFNRMCRQQRMVRAVAEEADPTTLAMSIPGLVSATEENIVTDIPISNIDAFVELALRIKDGGFASYPITQDVTFSGNPDFDLLKTWVQQSIDDSMTRGEPQSVRGDTEPGSTAPAETGTPPEEEEGSSEEETSAEETTPSDEPSSEEGTPSETPSSGEASTPPPAVDKDPLKSCLPGAEG